MRRPLSTRKAFPQSPPAASLMSHWLGPSGSPRPGPTLAKGRGKAGASSPESRVLPAERVATVKTPRGPTSLELGGDKAHLTLVPSFLSSSRGSSWCSHVPLHRWPYGGSEKHKDLWGPGQSNPKFSVSGEAARTGWAALWDVPGVGGGIPRGWEMQQAAPSGWPSVAPGERRGFGRGCIKRQVERPEQPGRGGSGCGHSQAPRMEGADWEGRLGVMLLEEGLFLVLQEAGGHRQLWGP